MLVKLPRDTVSRVVRLALEEDAPWGDLTSAALIPEEARITAHLVSREPGVLAGEELFAEAMNVCDARLIVEFSHHDGDRFTAGAQLGSVHGTARAILTAERVALNFVQRLSGIATLTAAFVAETAGTRARIVDTRKTTPGLRALERYAVRCGGGHNHRFSLSDAVMVKDNHLAVLAAAADRSGVAHDLTAALVALRERLPHTAHLEVEVDRPEQIEAVLAAKVDTLLLDNFSTEQMGEAVAQIAGRALIEASGGVRLERIREIAATGVDVISVGALTHSVRSLDLGLDIHAEGR